MSDTAPAIDPAHEAEPAPAAPRSSLGRMLRLARKELSEVLRDRRTVVTLVAMPLLLYPLLSVAFQQFFLASRANPEGGPTYRIGVSSKQEHYVLTKRLQRGYEALREQNPTVNGKEPTLPQIELNIASPEQLDEELHTGRIDLILRVPELTRMRGLPSPRWDWDFDAEASYRPEAPGALGALTLIERWLAAGYEEDLRDRLNRPGPGPRTVLLRLRRQPLEEAGSAMVSLASLVPLILILMTVTGAVYPAIDLTAGERERGTLETLMVAPVPTVDLIAGKFIVVTMIGMLSALLNLISIGGTVYLGGVGAALLPGSDLSIPLSSLPLVLVMLLPLAVLFSAMLLAVCSFARSFKEAQNYILPVMVAALIPGVVGILPATRLEGPILIMPVANVVVLTRDLFLGKSGLGESILWVVLSTSLYAAAAVAIAARLFGQEAVLFSDSGSIKTIFQRRFFKPRAAPTVSTAFLVLALAYTLNFYIQSALQKAGLGAGMDFLYALTITLLILLVVGPWFAARYARADVFNTFSLRMPTLPGIVAGLCFGLSTWLLMIQWMHVQNGFLPMNPDIQAQLVASEAWMNEISPWTLVVFLALIPAFCEEFFFRGFVLSGLRSGLGKWASLLIVAVAFGLNHHLVYRLIGTSALGLLLGLVVIQHRSIWPSMIAHLMHNGITILATTTLAPFFAGIGLTLEDGQGLPPLWIGIAVALAGLGVALCFVGVPREERAWRTGLQPVFSPRSA